MSSPTRRRALGARRQIDECIRHYASCRFRPLSHFSYFRIVDTLRASTDLLSPNRLGKRPQMLHPKRVLRAVAALADHNRRWERAPESFAPRGDASVMDQWAQFISHVLEAYPCPRTLSLSWLRGTRKSWRLLHFHVAEGDSLRRYTLPDGTRCSRATARHFTDAPDDLEPFQALRWAQVMGEAEQGCKRVPSSLVRTLALSVPLSADREREAFWPELFRFFLRYPDAATLVPSAVQLIQQLRFTPVLRMIDGVNEQVPLDPEFSLRGRTPESLRRLLATWPQVYQRRTGVAISHASAKHLCWPQIDVAGMTFPGNSHDQYWELIQLTSAMDLAAEGRVLRHCVGGYAHRCAIGRSSIWSLRQRAGLRAQSVVTIEVEPESRTIVAASGVRNRCADRKEARMIREWADSQRLSIHTNARLPL